MRGLGRGDWCCEFFGEEAGVSGVLAKDEAVGEKHFVEILAGEIVFPFGESFADVTFFVVE